MLQNVQINQSCMFMKLEKTDSQTVATTFETKCNKASSSSDVVKPNNRKRTNTTEVKCRKSSVALTTGSVSLSWWMILRPAQYQCRSADVNTAV